MQNNAILIKHEHPTVYFVVLNWNQYELSKDCLISLQQQDYNKFQVIVVDNGSTDDSIKRLENEFPDFTFIKQPVNIGYSPGNNVGIQSALSKNADYLFLLNNDTVVDPQMLSRLIDVSESSEEIGMVGPTMFIPKPLNTIRTGENIIDWKNANIIRREMGVQSKFKNLLKESPKEVDYIDTCAILIKKEVFQCIGLMNSKYFINFDDLDLNVRSHKAGFKIMYVPSARMWHKVSASMGFSSPGTTYYMTRNALLFFWTHGQSIWKINAVLRIIFRTIRTILSWSLKPKYRTNPLFRRKRDANIFALRDFFLGRFGKMGEDVSETCYTNISNP